jgi:LacI family transcriptional regulator
MNVSIKEVAAKAGVSNAMVSMALNNHPKVSQARKDQIQQLARKLGYRPSMVAQNLLGRKTSLIGLLLPSSAYVTVLDEIEGSLRQNGYNVIVCLTNYDLSLEQQYVDMLMRRRVEGMIVLPTVKREHEEYAHLLQPLKSGMSVVFVDHHTPDPRLPRVTTDDFKDVQTIMRHLIGLGYRRIAFAHVGIHEWDPCVGRMFEGYKASLAEAGLPYDESLSFQCGEVTMDEEATYHPDKVEAFLSRPNRPDAILAYTDMLAVKVMFTMHQMGIRIPDQTAIAGLGNHIASPFTLPPLTTLERGTIRTAQRAAEVMVELLKNGDPFSLPTYECFAGEIVIRQSCGAVLKK